MTLALCVLGKNHAEIERFLSMSGSIVSQECDEVFLVQNEKARFGGQAAIGNRFRESCKSDVFGLVHADTVFSKDALRTFRDTALTRNAVVGLVGITRQRDYIWSKAYGKTEEVSTLDGCSIFFPTQSPIRFDEATFDSFHCVVEDAALSAKRVHGMNVLVPHAEADHLEERNNPPDWLDNYWKYRALLAAKWSQIPFETT